MIQRTLAGISVAAIMVVGMAACSSGGGGSSGGGTAVKYSGSGNADSGKTLFTGAGGCAACHTIDGLTNGTIGPNLTHVAARLNGDQILTQIADPQKRPAPYATPPSGGTMTPNTLTTQQRDDVTAFLLTQK